MKEKHLHIVTHDVPWPADFGGVIDIYYKIKWLHAEGVKIHLHCFVKDRPATEQLNKYCVSVNYYPRKKNLLALSFSLPYIVQSRSNARLLSNLQKDEYPILFEGIHSTYFLGVLQKQGRKTFVRLFNAEHEYYGALAMNESNIFKKIYYLAEAGALKKYEKKIAPHTQLWALSTTDAKIYKKEFCAKNIHFLPVFLPWDEISVKDKPGSYCLYHGNLAINENENAAVWLINSVFADIKIPLIVAGNAPSKKLSLLVSKFEHISLVINPDEQTLQELIENASINVLPSFNKTGVKLKLLNALFNGKHCLVNEAGCAGSGVSELCHIAETSAAFQEKIKLLHAEPYTQKIMQHRSAALKSLYNNKKNALRIIAWIW